MAGGKEAINDKLAAAKVNDLFKLLEACVPPRVWKRPC